MLNSVLHKIQKARKYTFGQIIVKVAYMVQVRLKRFTSHVYFSKTFKIYKIKCLLNFLNANSGNWDLLFSKGLRLDEEVIRFQKELICIEADKYRAHRFDLLGSGESLLWNKNHTWSLDSKRLFASAGIDCENYQFIDWYSDFKSGHVWGQEYHEKIRYPFPGVDIKVPWELSRFQYGTCLGRAYQLSHDDKYADEIILQILDWIEQNPVAYGPNWVCPMDVGIRAANWLVSLELIKDSKHFNQEIQRYIYMSLFYHADFIYKHQEKDPFLTSNHYLSNLLGLFFIAHYLPKTFHVKKWLKYSKSEIEKEMFKQVYSDGTNFEASSSYHRLVLELFFFAAVLEKKTGGSFSEGYLHRLKKMFKVIELLSHDDSSMPQIGDNDSGRFIVLEKAHSPFLNHQYILAMGSSFFCEKMALKSNADLSAAFWLFDQGPYLNKERPIDVFYAFKDSGWYLLKNENFHCVISCGPNGQNDGGGHAHNDKLSFELSVFGKRFFVDCGTYLYTPDPEYRNVFRSNHSHNTLSLEGEEQNDWYKGSLGTFSLINQSRAKLIEFKPSYFIGQHEGYSSLHQREIKLDKDEIKIVDYCESDKKKILNFFLHPDVKIRLSHDKCKVFLESDGHSVFLAVHDGCELVLCESEYSCEYGVKVPCPSIQIYSDLNHLITRISIVG